MYSVQNQNIDSLLGEVFVSAKKLDDSDMFLQLTSVSGEKFVFWHEHEYSDSVWLEDVVGDLSDLLNSPIVLAEKSTSIVDADDIEPEYEDDEPWRQWTFYRLGTARGTVTLRFCGDCNTGRYSLDVDIKKMSSNN